MVKAILTWKEKNPNLYEFILFNIMSNVATVTNFVVLWISSSLIFTILTNRPFEWLIFNYPVEASGLGGFLSFVTAYIAAQIVNYFVQKNIVFGSNKSGKKSIGWYILTVLVAGVISVWLPPYIIEVTSPIVGGAAPTVANIVNILVQVAINYPMLKFVIMKKRK
jgi:putative flippase GtrA